MQDGDSYKVNVTVTRQAITQVCHTELDIVA